MTLSCISFTNFSPLFIYAMPAAWAACNLFGRPGGIHVFLESLPYPLQEIAGPQFIDGIRVAQKPNGVECAGGKHRLNPGIS